MKNPSLMIFRSVTYAQRAGRVLEKQGITTYMLRSQAILGGGSCSYALKVAPRELERSLEILHQCEIPVNGVYVLDQWGHYQKAQ